jgi:hypothetical protein
MSAVKSIFAAGDTKRGIMEKFSQDEGDCRGISCTNNLTIKGELRLF